jgi:soluble lytic murein transglycosylase-like protein
MATSAVLDIQSRIAEIQSRFSDPFKTQQSASANGAFASALDDALGTANGGASLSASGATGSDVVNDAKKYLGIPYVYGSTDPSKGLDCSSLVQLVYKDLGISLPRVASDQAKMGTPVASLAQAKPGDLVAFNKPVDHIGIYIGNNKMIVAPKAGDVVKVQDVYETPSAIRRIIPDAGSAVSSGLSTQLASMTAKTSSANFGNLSSQYNSLFTEAGKKHNISPTLLAAVAKQESGFNASAKSGAGAQGLMQIMPATAKSLGVNALNPSEAVDGAAKMLSGLITKFGSTELALAAYNAGPGAVQKYNGIPPYKETQNYVKKVTALVNGAGR